MLLQLHVVSFPIFLYHHQLLVLLHSWNRTLPRINETDEVGVAVLCIWEVPSSDLNHVTDSPDWDFSWVSSLSECKFEILPWDRPWPLPLRSAVTNHLCWASHFLLCDKTCAVETELLSSCKWIATSSTSQSALSSLYFIVHVCILVPIPFCHVIYLFNFFSLLRKVVDAIKAAFMIFTFHVW
jgi:hypothetical protein